MYGLIIRLALFYLIYVHFATRVAQELNLAALIFNFWSASSENLGFDDERLCY